MKIGTSQRSLLVLLFSVLLCSFEVNASAVRKTHALRARKLATSGATKEAVGNDEEKQGEDDDDDDDDDDSEDAAAPAGASPAAAAPAAAAPAAAAEPKLKTVTKKVSPHAAEKAKLERSVAKVQEELAANLAEQKELKDKISHLSDESESDKEIDASAKLVANETDSKAMAGMLGTMWKEMRMFDVPFFTQHVQEEINHLPKDEQKLEDELEAAQGRLIDAKKAWKAGKEAKAKVKDENSKAKATEKSDDDEDEAEDVPAAAKKKVEESLATATDAVPEVKTLKTGETAVDNGLDAIVMRKWGFWNMDAKQRMEVLISSLVYLLFGVLCAYLYQTARKRNLSFFEPKSRAPAVQDTSDFSFSLFGCLSDPTVCVVGFCCPCLRWAHTMEKKGIMRYWKAFFMMFVLMLLHVYTMGISTLLACIMGIYYRQKLRAAYNFEKGSAGKTMVMDILAWFCCQPCAIVQEAREEAAHAQLA